MIRHIVAIDDRNGFAKAGSIPWNLPADKAYYRNHIRGQYVLMGAGTYDPSATSNVEHAYVLSHDESLHVANGERVATVEQAIEKATGKDLWVIGGTAVYGPTIRLADELYITRVQGDFHCDRGYQPVPDNFKRIRQSEIQVENGLQYRFEVYARV